MITKTQIKKAQNLSYKSEQESIVCENHGTVLIITIENYIKKYLAIYEIKAVVTPTGQVILNKHYN